ncbi:MAG: NAD(P)H-dependent oxidoreductase [Firmicutes bacterium]|nr:NAD(P)H-dependent oxidoreductase [Bacillota bacterium]
MNILILNGSPKGENSVTLQTMRYLRECFPAHTYRELHVSQRIRSIEKDFSAAREALLAADLLVFCYPVYTFLVPAQLHRFIELIKASGVDLQGKYATQVSTSKHFYDTTAHEFIRQNCEDLGLRVIPGLSADMEDLLKEKGQKEAESFFRYALWSAGDASLRQPAAQKNRRVAIVADLAVGTEQLADMIECFKAVCPYSCDVVDLQQFPFSGGCLGCFHCAADGTCVYKDGFDTFLREKIQTADATVYAFAVKDHSMGYRMKLYDDRQFCNGHRTVTMGKPVGYLVQGSLDREANLRQLIEARAQVGGNHLAGIACSEDGGDAPIEQLSRQLVYALENDLQLPPNFYGVGGMKIFRDLIYQMQGLMKEDHKFYKEHGFYDDFPQKRKGTILGMYLVGAMMHNKKLSKKIGSNMTKGMLMPYEKVLKKGRKLRKQR